jgi:uncharacterized tellurite resistance protein B-like protein
MKNRLPQLADLLMGAAYADARLKGEEKAAVRRILREISGVTTLPMDLEMRIDEFNPKVFDLAATGAAFRADSDKEKRHLLDLVTVVHAADEEFDLAEDDYLRRVGEAIGLDEARFRDLVATVVEETRLSQEMRVVDFPPIKR